MVFYLVSFFFFYFLFTIHRWNQTLFGAIVNTPPMKPAQNIEMAIFNVLSRELCTFLVWMRDLFIAFKQMACWKWKDAIVSFVTSITQRFLSNIGFLFDGQTFPPTYVPFPTTGNENGLSDGTGKKRESRKAVVKKDTRYKLNPNRWAEKKKCYSICFSCKAFANRKKNCKSTLKIYCEWVKRNERQRVKTKKKDAAPTLFSIFKLITITWLWSYAMMKPSASWKKGRCTLFFCPS